MRFKAIKRGKTIEFSEELNIPDGQEIIVDIQDSQLIDQDKRLKEIHEIINNWDDEAREDFIKTMKELEREKNEQWEKLYGNSND
jgi:antitoxin component of MazEF toxin-antitoxin module